MGRVAHERVEERPMPTMENQKKIVDAYLAAFKKTPLLMLIDGGGMPKHATQTERAGGPTAWATWAFFRGIGVTCRGLSQVMPAAGARTHGRTAPVAWETCWDMRKWVSSRLVASLHIQLRLGPARIRHQQQVGPVAQG